MNTSRKLAVVIMAAGQGKRMQDPTKPKVLYTVAGTPMLGHVLKLCQNLNSELTIVVMGFGRDQVADYLRTDFPNVQTVIQDQQLGTGHAVQQAEIALSHFDGDVLVLSGDVPLLTQSSVEKLIVLHRSQRALASVLAVDLADPSGYGRIVRSSTGHLARIVEHKDATEDILKIKEINSGIYVFDNKTLFQTLKNLDRKNAQGEYYLTDCFAMIIERFGPTSVAISVTTDAIEVTGVNTRDQLLELESAYESRKPVR